MKNITRILLRVSIAMTPLLYASFVEELIQTQKNKGIRVFNQEETDFEKDIQNLLSLTQNLSLEQLSINNNAPQILNSFYTLFFNPAYIKFSTKSTMNTLFDQLKKWHDFLRKNDINIAWPANAQAENLKILLKLALKEICLFGRYTKNKEEHLVIFKLRLQQILTVLMLDAYVQEWKDQLITNNQEFSSGSFYSWEVKEIEQEFKDTVALTPLFNKLSKTIDFKNEASAAQEHQQALAQEKEVSSQKRHNAATALRAIIMRIKQQPQPITAPEKGQLYLDYIRALLDPAYLELSVEERKTIDNFNKEFKKLYESIGKTFIPILSQESINELKLLVAQSLETISSPLSGKTGGTAFKNHIESVLSTIMSINAHQTITENQIKFQWIKPLYTDNEFLTSATKKKLLDIFNNQHFQRWQSSIRNLSFKTTSTPQVIVQTELPLIRIPGPAPEKIKKPVVHKVAPANRVTFIPETIATPFTITPTQAPNPVNAIQPSSIDNSLHDLLLNAAALGKADTIATILKNLTPEERFSIIIMRNNNGQTALHLAAGAKSDPTQGFKPVNAVKELLRNLTQKQQVDLIIIKDNNGMTAQDIAQQQNKAVAINLKEIIQKSRR